MLIYRSTEVRRCTIFLNPLQLLLGGLLIDAEAGQLTLCPPANHQQ